MKVQTFVHALSLRPQDLTQITNFEITNLTQDTRQVTPNTCFVCIEGAVVDGHELAQQAVDAGATLIIAQHELHLTGEALVLVVADTHKALAELAVTFYGDPSEKMTVVGVTGTNGKTTITHLIDQIMDDHHHQTGIIGTMYNQIGTRKIPTINTTPDALTLQHLLREMVDAKVTTCAMEVSSHALIQGRARGIDFDVAVFTNLTSDHLDYHKTMENYFLAKSLLFSQLGNTYHEDTKTKSAVINIDDPYGKQLLPLTAANVLTFGCHGEGLIQAKNIQISSQGTDFVLQVHDTDYPVHMHLMGDFNVYNALAAFGACYAQGLTPEEIIDSLQRVTGVRGRFELVPNNAGITAIVDYAHTPDGLQNVLSTINKFAEHDVYCVVGCGGDRSKSKRPIMGNIAVQHSTHAVLTSDNPRTEDPNEILKDVIAQLKPGTFTEIVDRKEAILHALNEAKSGDVVLIAGKGHEDYQIIGHTKHHFDDREIVRNYFDRA